MHNAHCVLNFGIYTSHPAKALVAWSMLFIEMDKNKNAASVYAVAWHTHAHTHKSLGRRWAGWAAGLSFRAVRLCGDYIYQAMFVDII